MKRFLLLLTTALRPFPGSRPTVAAPSDKPPVDGWLRFQIAQLLRTARAAA